MTRLFSLNSPHSPSSASKLQYDLILPTAPLPCPAAPQPLLSASITCVTAQLLKPVFVAVAERQAFNWQLALTSGGMPSSHSAVSACHPRTQQ